MSKTKFYLCEHCKNLIGMVNDASVPVVCCGSKMTALVPNTTEAAGEKHLPIIEKNGNIVTVNIGSVNHPMTEEHSIQWVYIETKKGGQRKNLVPNEAPNVSFALTEDDEIIAAYAYCNLHGLWKAEA